MNMTKKIGLIFLSALVLILILVSSSGKITNAATNADFYFDSNGKHITSGGELTITMENTYVSVTSLTPWPSDSTVTWLSSQPGVVIIENTASSNMVNLVRKGPGYSTIMATINQGGFSYTVSFVVKVQLYFDAASTGMIPAQTTNENILVLNSIGDEKQVYLKYVDYTAGNGTDTVSGSAIDATAVTWESSNQNVATIDNNGKVTARGSGTTTIKATSVTMSTSDSSMSISMKVVVKPMFSLTYTNTSSTNVICESDTTVNSTTAIAMDVPSNFVIESKAIHATDLTWKVIDCSTGLTVITTGASSKMTYSVSTISGNVSFSNVKAGTYEIYAFANSSYNTSTNAPYAYMKIEVPIVLDDLNIVMTVGDTYNVIDNSNITGTKIFSGYNYTVGNPNIALFDKTNYTITAKLKGQVSIKLTYDPDQQLYDTSTPVPDITINITVIDGIALSASTATIYTEGTLLLNAIVTDTSSAITWSSSDDKTATVVDGLVTGVKAGTATITAKQIINGVAKTASCIITVQQSVTSITLDPSRTTLAIDKYVTLHAKVLPTNLSNITLKWKSSDDNVVVVSEAGNLSATIQGVAGGTAVISAINQDNVVVGYCHVTVLQPVKSIALSETDVTVGLSNRTLQLRAAVYPVNATNQAITWSTSDRTKATVDANGLVTLLKPGTVTIIATSVDNTAVTALCNINIATPVSSVTLDESTKTMYVGQSARLTYIILPTTSSNSAVIWTSTNTSVATVDTTGKVTTKAVGTTVIMIKTIDGGYTAYCTITVKRIATAVALDVTTLTLKAGEYYYIKPTLTPKDSTDTVLTWESSDTKIATVDDTGKVIGKSAGAAIIMVKTEAGGVAYCKVTVTQPVAGLILNFKEKTIYTGKSFKLEASVSPSTASNLNVTWVSSDTKVATVDTKGEVSGLVGGVAIISCTTVDGGYQAACIVTVKEPVTKISLDKETYNLGIKKTFKLTATVTNETASNIRVVWSSSNTKIATVNQKGKVTGIKSGYATITATAADGSEVEASCEVRVVTPVQTVTINRNYISLFVGDSKKLKATIKPTNATFKTAIWSSSDSNIAIVDDTGKVTALQAGKATITAETQDNTGKKVICTVIVNDHVAATGITLQDKKVTLVPGETKIVHMVIIPSISTDSTTWSTDNPAVASVDKKTGKIIAKSPGSAYITAMTDSGKAATVEVVVIGLNVTKIIAEEYTTYDQALVVEGATGTVTYKIDNPLVAVVSSDGTISTRGIGTATITATVNGRKLKCKLIVKAMK